MSWKVNGKVERRGNYKVGAGKQGDHQIEVRLFPAAPQFSKKRLLVVFKGCSEDPPTIGRPVTNLDELVEDKTAEPKYVENWTASPSRWKMCPETPAVLINPGKRPLVKLNVDFLRAIDGGLNPYIEADTYIVPAEIRQKTKDPAEMAALLAAQPANAVMTIGFYYSLNSKKKSWTYGTYESVIG